MGTAHRRTRDHPTKEVEMKISPVPAPRDRDRKCSRIELAAVGLVAALAGAVLAPGVSSAQAADHVAEAQPVSPPASAVTAIPSRSYVNHRTPHGYEMLVVGPGDQYTQLITSHGVSVRGTVTDRDTGDGHVVFLEGPGGVCPGRPGTYAASLDPGGLHLTVLQDSCNVRVSDFTSSSWTPFAERVDSDAAT
jgi:hypothetical protein